MAGSVSASTIAIASLAATAAATGLSVVGQMNQQQAQAQGAQAFQAQSVYQSQIARQNQTLADQRAADATQRGQVEEMKRRQLTQQQQGAQTAGLASQGTDLAGSPTDILGDTAAAGELDAQTIRANAARESYGYKVQGIGYGNEAALQTARAGNSNYSPSYLGSGASLLSGASTLGEKWWRFQKSGAFSSGDQSYGGAGGLGTINGNTYG